MNATMVWIGVVIYVISSLILAYYSRTGKAKDMTDYFLGNRKMGGFVSALSYSATTFSAFMLVGLAGLTYAGGVGALGFELIYFAGVSLIAFFGPRYWVAGKKYGYVTPTEMLGDRYESKTVAVVTALASCLFLIPYSAVQLTGVGYLLSSMSNNAITFTTGVTIATVLAIVFTIIAGIRSVMWTDAFQALVMIVTATLVVLIVVSRLGGFGSFFETLATEHPGSLSVPGNGFFSFPAFLSLTLPWIFFSISNPQVSQRLYMPSSFTSLRRMLIGFLVFGFIYTLVSILWGFAALIQFPGLDNADLATPTLLSSDLVPPILGVIVMIGIMAAAISTIDSIILTLSSIVARDVYGNAKRNPSEQRQLLVGKIVIPVIAVLAYLFAQLQLDLIAVLSVSASAGLLVIVPAYFGVFFWKRGTAAGVIASVVISGTLVSVLELTKFKPLGYGSGVWGLLLSIALFIGVSIVTKAPKEKATEFIQFVKSELKKHQKTNV
ncbi:sodium:solute symporter family protein [Pueribacillus sp. YX66]|uniref:sodium:solute symporter family protein n=1 Tax=Pueribacillus sp. YX66 TaxID=3229242 RepID=UPI00358D1651